MARESSRTHRDLACSFCGKHQEQVQRLIAGPRVYICDDCIRLCNEILAEEPPPALASQVNPEAAVPPTSAPLAPSTWWRRLTGWWRVDSAEELI